MKNLLHNILIALLTLAFYACKKNDAIDITIETESEITIQQMKNSNNPYDEQGAIHNSFLDFFINKTVGKKEINRDYLLDITAEYAKANKIEFSDNQQKAYTQLFDVYDQMKIGRPGPILPPNLCRWFPSICDIFTPSPTFPGLPINFLKEQKGDHATDRVLSFIAQIKKMEDELLKDESFSEDARYALLNQYAIARYSAAYWHNVQFVQKERSAVYDPLITLYGSPHSSCHTCDVVSIDATGGIITALISGIEPGTGSALASAAATLRETWNWSWE